MDSKQNLSNALLPEPPVLHGFELMDFGAHNARIRLKNDRIPPYRSINGCDYTVYFIVFDIEVDISHPHLEKLHDFSL
ncbi:hypothetical protein PRIPAC_82279 [Pristionchus pacificus]|uniref:Uncharacterized protein n=1 Tax=Pristionchus pacificus TaxID=54126 RepID=A0A2A6BY68_PRIPA|nr:hypothetical protein PRIPAC_82279 [Pristionchus pacificus]|eukprot:PDM70819.1 hypothetical protein PRIPAC_45023 [Pristionchus pacificus]